MLNVIDGLFIGLVCGVILEKVFSSRRKKLENNIQFPKPPEEYYRQLIRERREKQASMRRAYVYEENEPLFSPPPFPTENRSFRRVGTEPQAFLHPSFMRKFFKSKEPKEGKLIEVDFENRKRR